jgi:cytochrome c-type biogenesis protein CcmH/NrfG
MRALEVDPANAGARALLGRLDLVGKRPSEAAQQFRRAVDASPSPGACVGLAQALALMGRTAEATRQVEDAIRRYPESAEAHALLVSLRSLGGSPAGAVRAAREGLRVNPADARLHVSLARGLLRADESGEAVRHYRIALRNRPDSVTALADLAWVLATHEEGRFRDGAEAVVLAQRAVKLTKDPEPQSLRALAAAYAEAGDFTRAEMVAQRLLDQLARSGTDRMLDQLEGDLSRYRDGKPLREKPRSMFQNLQETR